ncbi:hypothetical protein RB195_018351 [Necator americanus]|uniref:Uncharacterized protein n=1 Tax=Necator americanus TaxID=51031 RepID=A0ABR1CCE4_NECAM
MYEGVERIILDQLIKHREKTTSDEQAGFHPGRSAIDQPTDYAYALINASRYGSLRDLERESGWTDSTRLELADELLPGLYAQEQRRWTDPLVQWVLMSLSGSIWKKPPGRKRKFWAEVMKEDLRTLGVNRQFRRDVRFRRIWDSDEWIDSVQAVAEEREDSVRTQKQHTSAQINRRRRSHNSYEVRNSTDWLDRDHATSTTTTTLSTTSIATSVAKPPEGTGSTTSTNADNSTTPSSFTLMETTIVNPTTYARSKSPRAASTAANELLFFLGIVAICLVIIVLMIIWVEIRKDKYAQRRKKSNDKIEPHHFNDYSADEERRVEHFDNNVLRTAELVSPVPVVDPVTADANRKRGEQEAPTTTSQPSTEVPREVETTSLAKRKSDKQSGSQTVPDDCYSERTA